MKHKVSVWSLLRGNENYSIKNESQQRLVSLISLIAISILSVFSIFNFMAGLQNLLWLQAATVLVFIPVIFCFYGLYNFLSLKAIESIILCAATINFHALIIFNSYSKTGIYWVPIFPFLAFFIVGLYKGWYWILAFIPIGIISIYFYQILGINTPYSLQELLVFILTFYFYTLVAAIFEGIRERQQLLLARTNQELEEARESILKNNQMLEQQVLERTNEILTRQEEISSIIDYAKEAIISSDVEGRILRVNTAACQLFGYDADAWSSLTIDDLVPNDMLHSHQQWIQEEVSENKYHIFGKLRTVRAQRMDGSTFFCELTVNTFQARDRVHMSIIMRDLTDYICHQWVVETLLKLRQVSQHSTPLDIRLKDMLGLILSEPWQITMNTGAILLAHKNTRQLIASHGWSAEDKEHCLSCSSSYCLCDQPLTHGKPVFCTKGLESQMLVNMDEQAVTQLCISIMYHGENLGLISLLLKAGQPVSDDFLSFYHEAEYIIAELLIRERAMKMREDSELKHRMLLENTPIGILIYMHGKIVYANKASVTLFSVQSDDAPLSYSALDFVKKWNGSQIMKQTMREINKDHTHTFEEKLTRLDGSIFWADVRSMPLEYEGQPAVQVLIDNISARKKAEEKLAWLSYYDELTKLPNRRLFMNRLEQAITLAQRQTEKLVVLYLDLNRLKIVNDTLGHICGDLVLQKTAQRIRKALRKSDTVARIGGDEFAVLLPDTDSLKAENVAFKISENFQSSYSVGDNSIISGVSIGLASFPDDGDSGAALIKRADAAMYYAKKSLIPVYCFSRELEMQNFHLMEMEKELIQAVDNKELILHYQCQFDIQVKKESRLVSLCDQGDQKMMNRNIIGVEALLRWHHPKLGSISPAVFIPLAEESGLITQVTEWVVATSARQAAVWEESGIRPQRIGINISSRLLMQKRLAQNIIQCIQKEGAKPEWFEIEVTETAVMYDPEAAIQIIQELVHAGISIAIDDFGTGYSSLTYLKRLPAERLKIDISFIRDLPRDEENVVIVRSTIALAHALGMKAIAEGVEHHTQLDFLRREGCDAMQGYLFNKPLPAAEITQYLVNQHPVSPLP